MSENTVWAPFARPAHCYYCYPGDDADGIGDNADDDDYDYIGCDGDDRQQTTSLLFKQFRQFKRSSHSQIASITNHWSSIAGSKGQHTQLRVRIALVLLLCWWIRYGRSATQNAVVVDLGTGRVKVDGAWCGGGRMIAIHDQIDYIRTTSTSSWCLRKSWSCVRQGIGMTV